MGSTMGRNQNHLFEPRLSSRKTSNSSSKQPSAALGNLCSRAIISGRNYSGKVSCPNVHEEGMGDVANDKSHVVEETEGMGDVANDKSHVVAATVTAASLQWEALEKLFCLLIVQNVLERRDLKESRPLPVLIGYKEVDLLKLNQSVVSLGGYQKVTASGLWRQVSEVLGFGSGCGPGIKLVYMKYLKPLESENLQSKKAIKMIRPIFESVASKLDSQCHQGPGQKLTSLDREPSETTVQKILSPFKRNKVARIQSVYKPKNILKKKMDREAKKRKGSRLCKLGKGNLQAISTTSRSAKRPSTKLDLSLPRKKKSRKSEERTKMLKDRVMEKAILTTEDHSTLEIKSYSIDIMDAYNWMKRMALNPGDTRNGEGPEGSNENEFWADLCRLSARRFRDCLWTRCPEVNYEAHQPYERNGVLYHSKHYDKFLQHKLADKRNGQQLSFDSKFQGTIRSSRLAADLCVHGYDGTSEVRYARIPRKRIPIGPDFQAEVAEHCCDIVPDSAIETEGVPADTQCGFCGEDKSKWYYFVGAQVWPVLGRSGVINEKRIGKRFPDCCSCLDPGSIDCFRFHIQHDRDILKSELGTAFFTWGFDSMGECVTEQWTAKEEEVYKSLVAMNPASEGKNFWEELPAALPSRDLKDFISYYFNVFVLRRRAAQNRHNLKEADSDDDESAGLF